MRVKNIYHTFILLANKICQDFHGIFLMHSRACLIFWRTFVQVCTNRNLEVIVYCCWNLRRRYHRAIYSSANVVERTSHTFIHAWEKWCDQVTRSKRDTLSMSLDNLIFFYADTTAIKASVFILTFYWQQTLIKHGYARKKCKPHRERSCDLPRLQDSGLQSVVKPEVWEAYGSVMHIAQ